MAINISVEGIAEKIILPVTIYNPQNNKFINCNGLLDTGASRTGLHENVISELDLKPEGKIDFYTPDGSHSRDLFNVNFKMFEDVVVNNLSASGFPIYGCDVLIGMDVISHFDFVLSHSKDSTHISIRYPSGGRIIF